MRRNSLILLTALVALGACQAAPGDQERLADICQLRPCSCVEQSTSALFDPETKPLQWREGGQAFCPEGYVLRLDQPPE